MNRDIQKFLDTLNTTYAKLHRNYEQAFWKSYMGDHSVDGVMAEAVAKRDAFRADGKLLAKVVSFLEAGKEVTVADKKRLGFWKMFFERYQMPEALLGLKKQIDALESKIQKSLATRTEGYIDPKTKKFVKASKNKMGAMMRTEHDEPLRRAAFVATEKLAVEHVDDYVRLVGLRNEFARNLGFEDFYAYKLQTEEGMKKQDLFALFDSVYEKTKYAFANIRKLEESMPGLRKPWNFGYMMAGNVTHEEDPYYPFDDAVMRWGKSFAALGIHYRRGKLQLDLLDREGKYNNGFCHYPDVVHRADGKWFKGSSNFTCNVVYGQIGSGAQGMHTLFHEGGHAADRLNSVMSEACINTEYPPASTAWAETQSMFLDTLYASIEWRTRYAKNADGQAYPFDLFERKIKKLGLLAPLGMMGIHDVMEFERRVYETKKITKQAVIKIAKQCYQKFFDRSSDSLMLLGVPHIYSWESACSYHGYGLAELALAQWREYFYTKYGYIVDNPNVGREMTAVWKLGSSHTFPEFVKIATRKKLSAHAFIKSATMSVAKKITLAKDRLKRMERVKEFAKEVDLGAEITLVHGREKVADNRKGFEVMAGRYKKWLNKDRK